MAHVTRPVHRRYHPVHVTVRFVVGCMRAQVVFGAVKRAIGAVNARNEAVFRVVEFSVQANHLHLIVEAEGRAELSQGMRSLNSRIARQVNRVLGRRGRLVSERHHEHALCCPRAVRHALGYVLANFRKHLTVEGRRGEPLDPCSSALHFIGFSELQGPALDVGSAVARARTWLLSHGWRRHGLISIWEVPRSAWK